MKSAARCSKSWRVLHQCSSLRTSCPEVVVALVMSSLGSLAVQGVDECTIWRGNLEFAKMVSVA